jgi:mannose-1-phosphate guanylyltransferase/mannose-6-phosphate isomerase
MSIHPIILCGGSGTRLWPLSRKSFPKQFVPLIHGKSLLHLTMSRLAPLGQQIICVASDAHRFLVADAMDQSGQKGSIILEPQGRNTAAAMAIAALRHDPSDLLLFCPADHHIQEVDKFIAMVQGAQTAALAGAIVTFGVSPSFPSTAYGYIEQSTTSQDGAYKVEQFIEKPDSTKAQTLLLHGNVLWNAGIFLVQAGVLLKALAEHAPDILISCEQAMEKASSDVHQGHEFVRPEPSAFIACRSQSIDYAVMEKYSHVVVVKFDGQWSDVGSWNAVAELSPADEHGNRIEGHGLVINGESNFIHSPQRSVVALGVSNLLIIDTPDALLVADSTSAENVKQVVEKLQSLGMPEAELHRKVSRPWGWYDGVDAGERFQVKRIGVKPGSSLSLQKHHHRAEHWIVVKGTAEVTRGNDVFLLSENQSTYIPIGEIHRLRNPGKVYLEMIEVQSGAYLGEDDIVRLEDDFGRQDRTGLSH